MSGSSRSARCALSDPLSSFPVHGWGHGTGFGVLCFCLVLPGEQQGFAHCWVVNRAHPAILYPSAVAGQREPAAAEPAPGDGEH